MFRLAVKEDSSPKGDGNRNISLISFTLTKLRKIVPRKGTETPSNDMLMFPSLVKEDSSPKGDGN